MNEQPRKRITIDAPSEFVILAARHLDATEGRVQVDTIVDASTRSAIDRVIAYVAKAHNSPADPEAERHAATPTESCRQKAGVLPHPPHKFMRGRTLYQCPGDATPAEAEAEQTTPSRRAGLRDEIAEALEAADNRIDGFDAGDLADAVLPVLYREWPWLRAEAEEAAIDTDTTQPEPATVTDPEWLRQQYAAALYDRERPPRDPAWADAYPVDREVFEAMADAVMRVRDRHVAQLRQRLELADRELAAWAAAESAAAAGSYAGRAEAAEQRADQLATALAEIFQAHDTGDLYGPAREDLNRWRAVLDQTQQPDGHVYLSTGCRHGDHAYCKNMTGLNGRKRPGECKHCGAKCICGCHEQRPA